MPVALFLELCYNTKQGSETMTSFEFENIYHTKEYQSQRNDYLSGIVAPENKVETEKIPLDAGFFLMSTEYTFKKQGNISKTAYEQSLISPDGTKIHSWQIADSHDFTDFAAIFTHSDSRLYFIYKEDLYGYSVLRLSDRKELHYIPRGIVTDGKFMGESFIMTDFHYCRENNIAAAGGCFWAAPYDTALLDMTSPLSEPKKLVTVHDIIDPNYENDTLEDIDFKKWDNGFLVLEADAVKEELRFSTENLRHFMAM